MRMHLQTRNPFYYSTNANRAASVNLPSELWTAIFQHLPLRDQKNIACASSGFQQIVRPLMWKEPQLRQQLELQDLKELAWRQVPIKQFKVSQLDWEASDLGDMVQLLLDRFELSSFCSER